MEISLCNPRNQCFQVALENLEIPRFFKQFVPKDSLFLSCACGMGPKQRSRQWEWSMGKSRLLCCLIDIKVFFCLQAASFSLYVVVFCSCPYANRILLPKFLSIFCSFILLYFRLFFSSLDSGSKHRRCSSHVHKDFVRRSGFAYRQQQQRSSYRTITIDQ